MGKEVPPKVVEVYQKGTPEFVIKKEDSVEVVEVKTKGKLGVGGGEGKREGSVDVVGTKRALSTTEEGDAKRAKTVA
jgi:hypothetical protein